VHGAFKFRPCNRYVANPTRVHEEHARADTVERVGECRRFDCLEIDHAADKHGAANMRGDEAHAPARVEVGDAVAGVTENAKQGDPRRRLFERDGYVVHPALRTRPLLEEAGFDQSVVWNYPVLFTKAGFRG
jgi:hypothetical protein